MILVNLFAHPVGRLMTLILMHFVWQGFAVQFLLIAIEESCGIRRAAHRYALSLGALVAMAVCPLATLTWLTMDRDATRSTGTGISLTGRAEILSTDTWRTPTVVGVRLPQWLLFVQPYILAGWLIGVTVISGRLLVGFVGLSQMRRGRLPLPLEMARVVERLSQQLRMKAIPAVCLSTHVTEAMAVGLVRPLVLIPAAWAMEMPLEMLEAILAHEMSHLRRRDLWVNFMQRIVEAFLFYHPAVWWLSHRLRMERELCTDELAVAVTGQRLVYVQALEQVAHRRRADVRPALAAFLRGETNMRLLERVRNVLGVSAKEQSRLWPAGLVALVLPLGLWMLSIGQPSAIADDERDDDKPVIELKVKTPDAKPDAESAKRHDKKSLEYRYFLKQEKPETSDEENEFRKFIVEVRKTDDPDTESPKKPAPKKVARTDNDEVPSKVLKPGSKEQHVIEELVASVKHLTAQVEKLQAEVAELRGEEPRKVRVKEPVRNELKPKVKATDESKRMSDYERKVREAFSKKVQSNDDAILIETIQAVKKKADEDVEGDKQQLEQKLKAILQKNELLRAEAVKALQEKKTVEIELLERAWINEKRAATAAALAEKRAAAAASEQEQSIRAQKEKAQAEQQNALKQLKQQLEQLEAAKVKAAKEVEQQKETAEKAVEKQKEKAKEIKEQEKEDSPK